MRHDFKHEDMPVGMLIHIVTHIHMDRIRTNLERYGVQRTYGPILKELSMSEGMTQKKLAENMRITAPSMSINLQKMETAGFLLRKPDDNDMRQMKLYLTDKGRETAEKADREIALANDKLVEALSDDEKSEFKRLLIKILESQKGSDC
jgi:Transcriptional regulators